MEFRGCADVAGVPYFPLRNAVFDLPPYRGKWPDALPAVRPVNHLVDDGQIIIRTRLSTAISTVVRAADPGVVVAYEADKFDPRRRVGWSVVATGHARTVNDPDEVWRYEQLLHPWVNRADTVLAIEPVVVSAFRIVAS